MVVISDLFFLIMANKVFNFCESTIWCWGDEKSLEHVEHWNDSNN